MSRNKKRLLLFTGIIIIVIIIVLLILLPGKEEEEPEPEPVTTTRAAVVEETTTEKETETETETTTEEIIYADPVIDFDALWEVNRDAYAYIEIPDTPVSYPIMRSSTQEDDYYLETTFEGYPGLPGSIYTQQITAKDFSDYISVIYGHDMADGSYFGSLYHFIEEDYFNAHPLLYIYTPEKQLTYHIIGESTVDDLNLSYLYDIEDPGSVELFWENIHNGEAENRFDEEYEYKKGDRFAVLSVCIGWRPENRRVIVGVLEEELPVRP